MSSELKETIAKLDSISSVEDEGELGRLDESLKQVFESEHPELGTEALFRVYERFPTEDAFGLFWAILSGLEKLPGYEQHLVESVKRRPSLFSLLMVNRLLNYGIRKVGGTDLFSLLEKVAGDENQQAEIREEAKDFIEWQQRGQ